MAHAVIAPDYEELGRVLGEAELSTGPSEAQGLICGVLCSAGNEQAGASWVPILLSEQGDRIESGGSDALKQATRSLIAVHHNLLESMHDKDFALRLMLPGEEMPVSTRLEALSDWCSGFLMGLVAGGAGDIGKLPPDSAEIARDMLKITEVVNMEEVGEEEEESLMQLEEYVRVGALAIYDELHADTSDSSTDGAPEGETRH